MAGAPHGGAETAFIDMSLALHNSGCDIEVVTRPNELRVGQLKDSGVTVHTLPFGAALDIYTPSQIKKIIKNYKPHIVQTWMSRASAKVPHWSVKSGTPKYVVVSRLGGYYKTKYFKNTDYFTTITPDIRQYLIREGISPDKVVTINNFAETEEIVTPVKRSEFDTPDSATVLLVLARLHEAKAIDVLIKAIKPLENTYLWIAGEGPLKETLEDLTETLELQGRVRFLGWRDDRAALLDEADICVFPSRYEPFGTVFVQAWAQKTPLITSDADGPRQFVNSEKDCLMVPKDNVEELSAAIKRLQDNPDFAKQLVKEGHKRYLSEFTKEKTVSCYLDYYKKLLHLEDIKRD
jgi:glycosyltransferase involved in cell wall biosynthesis